jgi:hypothetical protein
MSISESIISNLSRSYSFGLSETGRFDTDKKMSGECRSCIKVFSFDTLMSGVPGYYTLKNGHKCIKGVVDRVEL